VPTVRRHHVEKNALSYTLFPQNDIQIRVTLAQIESKTGLAADTTGVKASSPKTAIIAKHLKAIRVRASVTAIPADATVRVEIYNETKATVLGYAEFAGAAGETAAEVTSGWSDGDIVYLRVNVVTASATAGATFDLGYATLEADYGVS